MQLQRFKEGIERFAITGVNNPAARATAQSSAVVMHDRAKSYNGAGGKVDPSKWNHLPGGVNTLFMDGHIEFTKALQANGGGNYWPWRLGAHSGSRILLSPRPTVVSENSHHTM